MAQENSLLCCLFRCRLCAYDCGSVLSGSQYLISRLAEEVTQWIVRQEETCLSV